MDKKKLIGTIVGVIAFAALIAGATYAWLSNNLTVTNGVYNLKASNFVINYTNGTAITNVPILATATASTAKVVTVKAGLATGSTPGKLTIYLNTQTGTGNTDTELLDGPIKYSWCKGTSCSGTDFADHTKTLASADTPQVAVITNEALTTTTQNTYNIYFWLDGAKVGDSQLGKKYTGYISASATQTE